MIGNEGGFLAAPVNMTAAERQPAADGSGRARRRDRRLHQRAARATTSCGNVGPDDPFGGAARFDPDEVADPNSTGQIMQFRVVPARGGRPTTPPQFLVLPAIAPLPPCDGDPPGRPVGRDVHVLMPMRLLEVRLGHRHGRSQHGAGHWRVYAHDVDGTGDGESGCPDDRNLGVLQLPRRTPIPCTFTRCIFQVVNRQPIFVDEANMTVQVVPDSTPLTARALGERHTRTR